MDADGRDDGTPSGDPAPEGDEGAADDDDAYGGVLGAVPYAARASDSWLFRSYVLVGGLAAVVATVWFAIAVMIVLADTTGVSGGTFTFSRAFVVFVALAVVGPLVAPILVAARRHRRTGSARRDDAVLGGLGYLFLLSLYVALVISTPPDKRESVSGAAAPVVEFLYGLPAISGLVPPVVVAVVLWVVVRRLD